MIRLRNRSVPRLVIAVIFASLFLAAAQAASAANTIGGFVFDKSRAPLADIDIELLDEYYRLLPNGRAKTDGSGRYEFSGLNDGNYTVRAYAFRYDLEDQSQYVEIKSMSSIPGQQGSSYTPVDFYLQPKRGGLRDMEVGVVFAQEVPKAAQQAFKKAVSDLASKRTDEGFVGLQKALELFPTYYYALMRYGSELASRKQYTSAARVFLEAAQVNPKSPLAYYNAGWSLQLAGSKYYKHSATMLTEALKLAPASATAATALGTVERKLGKLDEAEKHLLLAKKLSVVKSPDIYRELAALYESQKKYKEAADEFDQYIKASKMNDEDEANAKRVAANLRAKAQSKSNE